jgi:hypothetical protein
VNNLFAVQRMSACSGSILRQAQDFRLSARADINGLRQDKDKGSSWRRPLASDEPRNTVPRALAHGRVTEAMSSLARPLAESNAPSGILQGA